MSPRIWRGILTALLFAANTVFYSIPILTFAVLKAAIPHKKWRRRCTRLMVGFGESWIAVNNWSIDTFHQVEWDIQGLEEVSDHGSYLVIANHQSWLDIPVLQYIFNRRIPFARFFLKSELFYIPVFGLVWWALDFPFMKRFSPDYLLKHPERRGHDLETAKHSVQRFQGDPVTVLNFIEGTRFTIKKREKQGAPFKHLLQPKTGGVANVLQTMGEQFAALLDVTIVYPEGRMNLWQAMCGRWRKAVVRVRSIEIPDWATRGDYQSDREQRRRMQGWVRQIWLEKDQTIEQLTIQHRSSR